VTALLDSVPEASRGDASLQAHGAAGNKLPGDAAALAARIAANPRDFEARFGLAAAV
jgi:putative thioredoxin